jgi:hypothetical protein
MPRNVLTTVADSGRELEVCANASLAAVVVDADRRPNRFTRRALSTVRS